jgi:hypothetical protein
VSPSTSGVSDGPRPNFADPRLRLRTAKKPWLGWLAWAPNRSSAWDVTHFTAARRCVFAIGDLVSRNSIDTLMSIEETSCADTCPRPRDNSTALASITS